MKARSNKKVATVYHILNPIFIISQFAGICTIRKDRKKNEIVVSRFLIIFQIVVLVVNVLHLISIPYNITSMEIQMLQLNKLPKNKSYVKTMLTNQHFITKMANPIIISITSIVLRTSNFILLHKYLPQILKIIDNVDRMIPSKNNNESKWILIFIIIAVLISWPFQIYSLVITEKTLTFALMLFINMYNNFSTVCCQFQYLSICWVIKARFNTINNELATLCSMKNNTGDENAFEMPSVIKSSFHDRTGAKILTSRKSYRLLHESCCKLNCLYDCQLLVSLGSSATNVLLNLYFAIFGGFKALASTGYTVQPIKNSIHDVIWSIYYFIQFVFICMVTGHLAKTANSTKAVICNLMNRNQDKIVKQELWMYLAYTMANKVHFTACGFFKVDIGLITAAVATGTTYLVILAQFHTYST